MAKFKVGDRVRIIGPEDCLHLGKQGCIWHIGNNNWHPREISAGTPANALAYSVWIDGIGIGDSDGTEFAFEAHELAPLVNPDEEAWLEFKKLLQPNPSILAKETV